MPRTNPGNVLGKNKTEYGKRTVWLSHDGESGLKLEFEEESEASSYYGFVLISLPETRQIIQLRLNAIGEEN